MAPLPVNVADEPAQITGGLLTAVTVGIGFTVNTTVAVHVQPALVPVTEYVVDRAGETVILVPVNPPGFQVYVVAPEAVSVEELPAQMEAGAAFAVTVGLGFTDTVTTTVLVQPEALDPVKV